MCYFKGLQVSKPSDSLRVQPNCPICGSYVKRNTPWDRPFNCLDCGTLLLSYPVYDSEGKWIEGEYTISSIIKVSTPAKRKSINPKMFE